jgi:hypothetical protein
MIVLGAAVQHGPALENDALPIGGQSRARPVYFSSFQLKDADDRGALPAFGAIPPNGLHPHCAVSFIKLGENRSRHASFSLLADRRAHA